MVCQHPSRSVFRVLSRIHEVVVHPGLKVAIGVFATVCGGLALGLSLRQRSRCPIGVRSGRVSGEQQPPTPELERAKRSLTSAFFRANEEFEASGEGRRLLSLWRGEPSAKLSRRSSREPDPPFGPGSKQDTPSFLLLWRTRLPQTRPWFDCRTLTLLFGDRYQQVGFKS